MFVRIAILKESGSLEFYTRLEGLNNAASYVNNSDMGFVVAPEYFFRHRNATKVDEKDTMTGQSVPHLNNYHIDSGLKDYLKKQLNDISQTHERTVIVPGTVSWKEASSTRTLTSLTNLSFTDRSNNMRIDPFRKKYLLEMKQIGVDYIEDILHNTMYIYYDGNEYPIDKDGDFGESTENSILVPEYNTTVLQIGRLQVGFEICLDHVLGRLKNSLGGREVDVQVIVSDFTPTITGNLCVREEGLVIHASTVDRHWQESNRYLEVWPLFSPFSFIVDVKHGTYKPKSTVKGGTGGWVQTQVGTLQRSALHNKRVTNVLQRHGNTWESKKVTHREDEFFHIVETLI